MRSKKDKRRLAFFILFLAIAVIVLIGRLFLLMIILPSQEKQETIKFPVIERGSILDRNGRILAVSTKLDSVAAWMPNIEDPSKTATILSTILDLKKEEILNKFKTHSGFVFLKRLVSPEVSDKIRSLKGKHLLKGINLISEYGRSYPQQELASHVLGYVGVDNIGLAGIEYSFNQVLSPPAMGKGLKKVYGNQVFLTIDINIQYIIEKAAEEAFKKNAADSVMVLAMEAKTGRMLGYVSIPNFNPNDYARYKSNVLINKPLTFTYEPGSVFKIFSISSMLQTGAVSINDHFYSNGFYKKTLNNGQTIIIKDLGVYGDVTPQRIIQLSSNVGAAYASDRIDKNSFYQMLIKFGFGQPTGLPLPGESSGILRKPQKWSARSKPTIAMGQEIGVSTIQVISAATVFANGGVLLKPRIVEKIVSPQGDVIKEYPRDPVREVLSPETAEQMLLMMETATEDHGTARRAKIKGLRISAKTGTAQVLDRKTGKYSKNHFISSFLGIFPTNNPEIIVYVVIDNPKYEKYGGRIAAPVFKQIAEYIVTYRGIPLKTDTVYKEKQEISLSIPNQVKVGKVMPNLKGKPKRSLLPLLKLKDFNVHILGTGYVVSQNPKAGTALKKGMDITIILK
ncbi:MAG: transpeptidase family protein [Spirochaetales bacterium]|nr:transpeptidase family protein [Spirochaetales bacterium]